MRPAEGAGGRLRRLQGDMTGPPVLMEATGGVPSYVFTNEKAGMQGVDKDYVKKVVYEMSKDSKHFHNEQRKQQHVEERISRLKAAATALTPHELAKCTRSMDAKIAELKAGVDLSRTWMHVDMDAFYAACEELDDPSLKRKPMAVGGIGMICTANYTARRYGVRSAMPGFIGRRLCPELVFVRPDFRKYTKASSLTRAIFREIDPDFEAGSLDEAYLDITDYCAGHNTTGEAVAAELRGRIHAETGLTCSCGVAANRLLAKVSSDINKPNGQFVLEATQPAIYSFIDALPVRKIPGIGKVQEQLLAALGMVKCADLIAQRGLVAALFSPVATDFFLRSGLGLGPTRHGMPPRAGEVGRKGISCERTFAALSAPADLQDKCTELSERLAEEMADEALRGKTLTLKLKSTAFDVRTRAITLAQHISTATEIRAVALRLLQAELPIEIRLMGIRMSNFLEDRTAPHHRHIATFFRHDSDAGRDAAEAPCSACPAQPDHNAACCARDGPAEAGFVGSESGAVQADCSCGGAAEGGTGLSSSQPPLELTLRDWSSPGRTDGYLPEEGEELPISPAARKDEPDCSDPAEAEEAAACELQADAGTGPAGMLRGNGVSLRPPVQDPWACQICTYAENSWRLLRCEVCDVLRGTTWQRMTNSAAAQGTLSAGRPNMACASKGTAPEWVAHSARLIDAKPRCLLKQAAGKSRQRSIRSYFGRDRAGEEVEATPAMLGEVACPIQAQWQAQEQSLKRQRV